MTDPVGRRRPGLVAVNHSRRASVDTALQAARAAAFGPREFVGQESFMRASEILRLAAVAGIGPASSVLDVCCGVGGPGLLIARAFGCDYHGVDVSESAVHIARSRAGNLPCRFDIAEVPPLPPGPYDVVVLLETLLAFPDKPVLLQNIRDALQVRGRFAFTLEEGAPLTDAERADMPDAHTVQLVPLPVMRSMLAAAGFQVTLQTECTGSHREVATRLRSAFVADADRISAQIGTDEVESLLAAHQLWIDWLGSGRVRKFMFVAERTDSALTGPLTQ